MPRLYCEGLESRDNPSGPSILDPTGNPVCTGTPSNVPGQTPVDPNANPGSGLTAAQIAIQQILDAAAAALANHL